MPRSASLVLALLGGALMAAACYSEKPAPPGYRYACSSDGDCRSNEECTEGICLTPCTQATAKDDCQGSDHLLCFNGVCTSGCQVSDENCPASQECIDLEMLGITLDSGGGGFISSSSGPTGLCGSLCDVNDPDACPGDEQCLFGFCVAPCDAMGMCPSPFTCQGGLCLPELPDTAGEADSAASSSESGESTTMATGSESGDATSSGGVL
ncbi:MAG TPA: hypothetical protein VG755_18430 [Nannocystaceae bacterium]|nr:hypothetical protein [Nannocystaceae bacterium]